jgi:hypothetical protein
MKVARYNGKGKWHIVERTTREGIPVAVCGRRMVNGFTREGGKWTSAPAPTIPIMPHHDICKDCTKRREVSA